MIDSTLRALLYVYYAPLSAAFTQKGSKLLSLVWLCLKMPFSSVAMEISV